MLMNNTKDIVDIVQGVVTIVAILVGGVWTYLAFVRNRLRMPRALADAEQRMLCLMKEYVRRFSLTSKPMISLADAADNLKIPHHKRMVSGEDVQALYEQGEYGTLIRYAAADVVLEQYAPARDRVGAVRDRPRRASSPATARVKRGQLVLCRLSVRGWKTTPDPGRELGLLVDGPRATLRIGLRQ